MQTYVVAMKPNLPEININVDGQLVTILPFAKTMGDVKTKCELNDVLKDDQKIVRQCQSTNQIADFYECSAKSQFCAKIKTAKPLF